MVRLSTIVNSAADPAAGDLVKKHTVVEINHVPIIAVIPKYGWL